jgi:hypothetical protein
MNHGLAQQCEREVVVVTRQDRRTAHASPRVGRRGRPQGSLNKKTAHRYEASSQNLQKRGSITHDANSSMILPEQASQGLAVANTFSFPQSEEHPFMTNDIPMFEQSRPITTNSPHQTYGQESPTGNSTISGSLQSQSPNDIGDSVPTSQFTNRWRNDEALAENAAMTLEFLAWGRQRDTGVSPESIISIPQPTAMLDTLNIQQAKGVVDFHRGSLTWMHNIVHWPTFYGECENFWHHGVVEEKAWTALYYSVLAVRIIEKLNCFQGYK